MKEFLDKPSGRNEWEVHQDGMVYYPYDPSRLISGDYFDIFKQTCWGRKYELTSDWTFIDSNSSQNILLAEGTTVELSNITDHNLPKQLKIEILVYSSLKDNNPKKYLFVRNFEIKEK